MHVKAIKYSQGGTSVSFINPNQMKRHFGSDNKWKRVDPNQCDLSIVFSTDHAPFEFEEPIGKNTLDLIVRNWDVFTTTTK